MNLIASDAMTWFDAERGVLDRRIFADEDIYQRELTNIFARTWNFVAHESQVRDRGDYFMSWIGEDEVIVVRDRQDEIQVLLNTCPHRGNTICRAEFGNARSFYCSYHGWNFDLSGNLIGMPAEKALYRGGLDKADWGMTRAARVGNYRGFIFATMDVEAPPLEDYLGWVGRLGLDMHASKGELEVLDGIQKNRLQCNWKIAADNLFDWYHVGVSHGTALKVGVLTEESMSRDKQMVMLGDYGHGIGGPGMREEEYADALERHAGEGLGAQWYDFQAAQRVEPEVREQLGPLGTRALGHPSIFPNLWMALTNQICLRIPRGPFETEIWWFTLLPKDYPEPMRRRAIYQANHLFGPAGFLEQDDGENWSHSTRGARGTISREQPVNLTMGRGLDSVQHDPSGQSAIETVVNEHAQRWNYENWQAWMRADSWAELEELRPKPPTGTV